MKSIWEFFNSLKLTVYLVLAMTAVTIYGSMVIYARPDIFGEMEQSLFLRWLAGPGLSHLGQTWWLFLLVAIVVLFGINTFVCTLTRLPVVYRRWKYPLTNLRDVELGGEKGVLVSNGEPMRRVPDLLRANGYSVFSEGDLVYAEKNRWLPFLPYVVHVGVILFLICHLISGLYGYRNSGLYIFQGDAAKSPGGDYYLRLDRVVVENRPDGSLKNYGSFLTAIKDGKTLKTGFVTANKPMFVEGGAVYQREFGENLKGIYLELENRPSGAKESLYLPRAVKEAAIPGTPYTIGIDKFIPDFGVDQNGEPVSLSDNLANPAVMLSLWEGGKIRSQGWLFLKDPGRDTFKDAAISLRMTDLDIRPYSSFDVNRDPSVLLALVAACLVMFGTLVTLYFRRERAWAKIDEKGGRAQVVCTDEDLYEKLV
ncbi:MAG: cytochrome c biogenesis protein ResB [Nitrospirota bacterium]